MLDQKIILYYLIWYYNNNKNIIIKYNITSTNERLHCLQSKYFLHGRGVLDWGSNVKWLVIFGICIPPFVLTVLRIETKSTWMVKTKWTSLVPKLKCGIAYCLKRKSAYCSRILCCRSEVVFIMNMASMMAKSGTHSCVDRKGEVTDERQRDSSLSTYSYCLCVDYHKPQPRT